MERTIAIIMRNLLGFRARQAPELLSSPKQVLTGDFTLLAAAPPRELGFFLPPGSGLGQTLAGLCALYGALRYFYTGEVIRVYLNRPPARDLPWLEYRPLEDPKKAISLNPDGSLACFLPDLAPGLCTAFSPKEYFITPQLASWLAARVWNFPTLRPGQYQVIERLCRGKNTLAIMPTGAGKSLCFQLPAMLFPGLTLVVSPLKSLMRDQYTNLVGAGIRGADFIDSSKSPEEKGRVLEKLRGGQIKLLYLSPERLQIESFQQEMAQALESWPVSLFAIDEAHCISEWGHDFRPSYLRLSRFIAQLEGPPVCALTATASRYVRQDILTLLGLNNQDLVTPGSLDRKEISLQVRLLAPDEDFQPALLALIEEEVPRVLNRSLAEVHRQGAGLIFTPYAAPRGRFTKPLGSEAISGYLQEQGLECKHYHAQLPDSLRIAIQDEFKENSFPLLVATKGYGMGIDKENIDYVIHLSSPGSLEAYYQEAGRGGRDGEHAHSAILARPRLEKCQQAYPALPGCSRGWQCEFTGGEKCSYGIQAGLLALEYPTEQETLKHFTGFLKKLAGQARGERHFRYVCPSRQASRQQKYLYYLEVLGAVSEYRVLEYRRIDDSQFDLLLAVELAAADSLDNHYWLAGKVAERIETYKAQKLNMLDTVQMYIKTDTCRRRFLMQYFGDAAPYERCNFCDSEGISPEAAPRGIRSAHLGRSLGYLDRALVDQDLDRALALLARPDSVDIAEDILVRSLRELEDRPYNPAALFLAGLLSWKSPDTRASGRRNLEGAIEEALVRSPQLIPSMLAQLSDPDSINALALKYLDRLEYPLVRELAAALEPPDRYPHIHLTLLLPRLLQVNQALMEVPTDDR